MQTIRLLFLLSLYIVILPVYALTNIESLAVFQDSMKKNASSIWPGLKIGNRPTIVAIEDTNELYAFDLTVNDNRWQKRVVQGVPVNYMPDNIIGFNAEHDIFQPGGFFMFNNQQIIPTFAYTTEGYDGNDYFNKLSMSLAYYFAYELNDSPYAKNKIKFVNKYLNPTVYNAFNNANIVSLLYIELSILKDYVTTQNMELLKTFAAVHQYRTMQLDANAKNFEIDNDIPFWYITLKALELNGGDTSALLIHEYNDCFYDDKAYALSRYYIDTLSRIFETEQYVLDKIEPDWKVDVEKNDTTTTSIFMKHYPLSTEEIQSLTATAKSHYGYDALFQKYNNMLTPYLAEMNQLLDEYKKQNDVEFIIQKQSIGNFSRYGYSATLYKPNSSGTTLFANATYVDYEYENITFHEEKMPLCIMFPSSDVLAKFKLSSDTILILNNDEKITIAKFMQMKKPRKINHLEVNEENGMRLLITTKGKVLMVVNGKLELH